METMPVEKLLARLFSFTKTASSLLSNDPISLAEDLEEIAADIRVLAASSSSGRQEDFNT